MRTIKKVFDVYNYDELSEEAKEKGYRGKRGKYPTAYSIQKIITRTEYCGYNIFHGEIYKGYYDPIIDVETYNKTVSLLKRQGKNIGRKRIDPLIRI